MTIKHNNVEEAAHKMRVLGRMALRMALLCQQLALRFWFCLLGGMCLMSVSAGAVAVAGAAPQPRWSQLADSVFQHLTVENGLPNLSVMALAEDRHGFLWVGTQGGLARWDGYRFRVYQPNPDDAGSLPDNFIQKLHIDRQGQLWVGTNSGGLARYDDVNDRFIRLPVGSGGIDHDAVYDIANDDGDGLWVGSRSGLSHVMPDRIGNNAKAQAVPGRQGSLPSDIVRTLMRDAKGKLWVGTDKGLLMQDLKTGSFIAVALPTEIVPRISYLFQGGDGRIWVGTFAYGAFVIDPASGGVQAVQESDADGGSLKNQDVTFIAQANASQIWISTDGHGMVAIDSATMGTRRMRHDASLATSVADNSIWALLRDRSGLMWVGSQRGLSRHDPNQTAVLSLFGSLTRPAGIGDLNTLSVLPLSDGRLWLGLQTKGINVIDADSAHIKLLNNDVSQRKEKLPQLRGVQAMVSEVGKIGEISERSAAAVYLATERGLYRTDQGGTTLQKLMLPPRDPNGTVTALLRDGNRLWIGGEDGLWEIDLTATPLHALRPSGAQALNQESIGTLARGPDGALWIGTANSGLYRLDPLTHQLLHVAADPADKTALSSGSIASLLIDSRGKLWVGTFGGGVNLLLAQDANGRMRFQRIGVMQGMPNGLIDKMLEDNAGNIWCSTDDGLAVIDHKTHKVRSLQRAEGVAIATYWVNAGARTARGELLFGGAGGMTVVRPELLKEWRYRPPVVVTQIHLGGKEVAAGRPGILTIEAQSNSIVVEFAALDYSAPERNRYAYKLDGYDQDWHDTDPSRRLAAYTNLPPGDYQLRLRGSNRNRVWTEQEVVLPIRVLPAWHQTWWFRLVEILGAATVVLFLVQVRTKYLRQQQLQLHSQVRQRTAELRQKQLELQSANEGLHSANAGLALSVDTLRELGDIGLQITANLDAEIVFRSLYKHVGSLLGAPAMTIYRANANATMLELVFGRDGDEILPIESIGTDELNSFAAQAVRDRKELLLDFDPTINAPTHMPGTSMMLTALFAPLIVDGRVLGVMSIQSHMRHAYGERECLIFRSLCAYGAIAFANAQALEALHNAQVQLVEQAKLASLGGMVDGIAHEINTPLGTTLIALSGIADVWQRLREAVAANRLSKSLLDQCTEEGLEFTNLALRTGSHAADLIKSFKAIAARSESDHAAEIDVAVYLRDIATSMYPPLELSQCKLIIDVTKGLRVRIVTEALTEALTRILANVADHAFIGGRTGTLHLCAHAGDEGDVVIMISDDGHGIAPDDLPKVFDPFFTTRSGAQGHVGLGLHVAYNHVTQRLKGEISIASTLGEGTTVTICLKNACVHEVQ